MTSEGTSPSCERRTSTSVEMFMETSYIDRILEQASMKTCRAATTPGTDALKQGKAGLAEALSPEEHQHCRKLVGQLLWLHDLRMDRRGKGVVSRTRCTDHKSLGKAWHGILERYQGLHARDLSETSPVGRAFLIGCSHFCGQWLDQ